MANARTFKATVWEDGAASLVAFLPKIEDGSPAVPADFSSLVLRSYSLTRPADIAGGTLVVPAGEDPGTYTGTALNPVDVVLAVPYTSGPLAEGAGEFGNNVRIDLDGSYWPLAGYYRIEVIVTPETGGAFPIVVNVTALEVRST